LAAVIQKTKRKAGGCSKKVVHPCTRLLLNLAHSRAIPPLVKTSVS